MVQHWLLRVGDASNFIKAIPYNLWGISSSTKTNMKFLSYVSKGDILWFVKNSSNGQLIAVASYVGHQRRTIGPLVSLSKTDEELGWSGTSGKYDVEILYDNIYIIDRCNLQSNIQGACVIRRYNHNCKLDLPRVYERIKLYSKSYKL